MSLCIQIKVLLVYQYYLQSDAESSDKIVDSEDAADAQCLMEALSLKRSLYTVVCTHNPESMSGNEAR
jgi:hypothetical protein